MEPLRFALIGCSKIAFKHAAALRMLVEAKLAAVCDLQTDRARALGSEFGVPWYTNYEEMLYKTEVDVVSVLTPSGDHCRRVLDLVRFKKHLVVEKPLALRIEDADRMIAACDHEGLKLFEVKQNRFNVPIRKLREAVDSGRFGRMVLGSVRVRWCRTQAYYDSAAWRGTWAEDGGVLTNQAIHHIDMLKWMMGDVETVEAMTATRLTRIEAEDTGVVILRFVNGALGVIEATTATRPRDLEGSLSILGENGTVEIGGFAMDRIQTWEFTQPLPEDDVVRSQYASNPGNLGYNHAEFLRDVVQSIREGKRGVVDGIEARATLELINAIYESHETGRQVRLRFTPKLCKLGVRNS
jgi:UDP-N-acetyl-2-amino-2-deoxyglucuronate dehydrogenase